MNKTPHESSLQKDLLFQKVGIFIDAENIELSGLKHHEGRTDYRKILDQVGDREILRILYYKPEYKEISPDFDTFWKNLGGEIKRPQKNADSFLIIDAVTLADKLDVVIILGGDKDFLPLVWYLKSRGCRVEIWSWPEATSPEVKDAADFYFPITKDYVITAQKRSTKKKAGPRKKSQSSSGSGSSSSSSSSRSSSSGSSRSSGSSSSRSSGNKGSGSSSSGNKSSKKS